MVTEQLMDVSTIIGTVDADVYAIAASRDGRYAVAGSLEGEVIVYDIDTWLQRFARLRVLPGVVVRVAIGNDGSFLLASATRNNATPPR